MLVLGERCVHLAQYLLEMGLDVCRIVHAGLCPHGIEVIVVLKPLLYLSAKTFAYAALPCRLLADVVAGIEREDVQEIDIVVEQQHGVAVKQTVHELHILMLVLLTIGLLNAVIVITQLVIQLG